MIRLQRFMLQILLTIICCQLGQKLKAQTKIHDDDFPELISTTIKGAPKLTQPVLLMAESRPAWAEGIGWAAPAVWDWNKDGKKDLLIGEFGTGVEHQNVYGHFIRVYQNKGTDAKPEFPDEYSYARPVNNIGGAYPKTLAHLVNNGTPLSINQFCCMAFTPQFADINNDGFADLYTGQYSPGEVTWFRGSERGFFPGEKLPQAGKPEETKMYRSGLPITSPENSGYWAYSAVSFADFTGDGLKDMIVGGPGLRISKNIGTKESPKFGIRTWLLDRAGKPIWDNLFNTLAIPYVVDWDSDGLLDLLVTSSFSKPGEHAVTFFRGIKMKNEYRFEHGVPLFTLKGKEKSFPGEYLNLCVTDWNNDGINDLLIGTKVALLNGQFDEKLNYTWGSEFDYLLIKSNPGYFSSKQQEEVEKKLEAAHKLEAEIGVEEMKKRARSGIGEDYKTYKTSEEILNEYYGGNEKYKALVHKGYVYLLIGKN